LPSCLQLAQSDSCHHSTLCTTSFPQWSLIERYAVSLVFWWFDSLSKEKVVLLGSCLQCNLPCWDLYKGIIPWVQMGMSWHWSIWGE
jgi:hypothetical protein